MPDAQIISIGSNLPEKMTEDKPPKSFTEWLRALADAVDQGKFPNLERAMVCGYSFEGHIKYDVSRQLRKDQVVAMLELTKLTAAF